LRLVTFSALSLSTKNQDDLSTHSSKEMYSVLSDLPHNKRELQT
jgi:hypothetical protein